MIDPTTATAHLALHGHATGGSTPAAKSGKAGAGAKPAGPLTEQMIPLDQDFADF